MALQYPWDETTAASYDADDTVFAPEVPGTSVTFPAGLAAGRPVLEFAAGTGLVTLPLAAQGLDVALSSSPNRWHCTVADSASHLSVWRNPDAGGVDRG